MLPRLLIKAQGTPRLGYTKRGGSVDMVFLGILVFGTTV
jgi:hypothetical protein